MAKKTLLSFREWQQLVRARKERAAERRAQDKRARLAAWWAIPADRHYVELEVSFTAPEAVALGNAVDAGVLQVRGRVLPDKRRH